MQETWETTDLRPCDDPGLENHLGLRAEVLRLPKDEVRELPNRDVSDQVADAVCDCSAAVSMKVSEAYGRGTVVAWPERVDPYGLIVYFAMYLLTRPLSWLMGSPSSVSGPHRPRILLAVRQVLLTTSPTRPIACESELIMEMAPMSWRTSSAAMVSLRMRDSANATSSGMFLSRWCATISICN